MAVEKPTRILVHWKGNQSKRYDNTKEEIWLLNVVAINESPVIDLTIDLVSVGDHIEYEFVAKRGRIQLWYGVVVSTDPDAERRATHIGAARSAAGGTKSSVDVDTEYRATTTATASKPVEKCWSEPASGVRCSKGEDTEGHTASGSAATKSRSRKKRQSGSPLPADPVPKQKRCATCA